MTNRVIAEVVNVGKQYKTGDTVITALASSSMNLKSGELTLIIGPSGSGKTTLLSLFGCVIYPSFGDVFVDGVKMNDLSENELAAIRLKKIGFVFQQFNLVAPLNSLENVMLPMLLQGISESEASKRASSVLANVGMSKKLNKLPKTLSGGEQQRVAIARALVTDPDMILCDEPTASLDIKSVAVVMEELKQIAAKGKAVAVVTHDTRLTTFANRIVYVNDGMVSDKPFEDENFTKI
ncbi:MAG: ABC transporter ATP-binding protein [Chitinophagaceae bacterium]